MGGNCNYQDNIGMLNNGGMRRQPPPGFIVGGRGKTLKSLPLNSVQLAQRWAKAKQF